MHNRHFLSTLAIEHQDWVVTAAFYAALHAAEVLFAFDATAPHHSHEARDRTLGYSRYDKIRTSYQVLKNASRIARYECGPISVFRTEDITNILLGKHLRIIEAFVREEVDPEAKHIQLAPIMWPREN